MPTWQIFPGNPAHRSYFSFQTIIVLSKEGTLILKNCKLFRSLRLNSGRVCVSSCISFAEETVADTADCGVWKTTSDKKTQMQSEIHITFALVNLYAIIKFEWKHKKTIEVLSNKQQGYDPNANAILMLYWPIRSLKKVISKRSAAARSQSQNPPHF